MNPANDPVIIAIAAAHRFSESRAIRVKLTAERDSKEVCWVNVPRKHVVEIEQQFARAGCSVVRSGVNNGS